VSQYERERYFFNVQVGQGSTWPLWFRSHGEGWQQLVLRCLFWGIPARCYFSAEVAAGERTLGLLLDLVRVRISFVSSETRSTFVLNAVPTMSIQD